MRTYFSNRPTKTAIQGDKCLSDEYNAQMLKDYPNMMGSDAFKRMLNNKIVEMAASGETNRRVVVEIPLVVHVLHNE